MFKSSVAVEWIPVDRIYVLKFKAELKVEFSIETRIFIKLKFNWFFNLKYQTNWSSWIVVV